MGVRRVHCDDQRGFTVLELLVVLAVVGILATAVVPGFVALVDRSFLVSRSNTVVGTLQAARGLAMRQAANVTMEYDTDGEVLILRDAGSGDVIGRSGSMSGVELDWPGALTFAPDGQIVGATGIARVGLARKSSRLFCVYPTGVIATAEKDPTGLCEVSA